MFAFHKPTTAAIESQIAAASALPSFKPPILSLAARLDPSVRLPFGFSHDHRRSTLGKGESAFSAAKSAFRRWAMFDLGWVRVANPHAPIAVGQIVAVEVRALGLWSLNLSRIVATIDTEAEFGFLYSTTSIHIEQGEERFLVQFDLQSGQVCYELEAISSPRNVLARLGFPVTRAFQHKFAADSHRKMREETHLS